MIEVLLVCCKDGAFKSCTASGHAEFAVKGKDIVCAAVTELLRTAVQVLQETKGMSVNVETPSRGKLAFSVEVYGGSEQTERLKCTADFIRLGVKNLAEEYPANVLLREISE